MKIQLKTANTINRGEKPVTSTAPFAKKTTTLRTKKYTEKQSIIAQKWKKSTR